MIQKDEFPIEKPMQFDQIVYNFLSYPQQRVMLLEGHSGTGKTINLLRLQEAYLEKVGLDEPFKINFNDVKVLYIDLKYFTQETARDCVERTLSKMKAKVSDWQAQSVLLLLDGYDKIAGGSSDNLYLQNQLAHWPRLKVIISCDTQALPIGYEKKFAPLDRLDRVQRHMFCNYQLTAFGEPEVTKYLEGYVRQHHDYDGFGLTVKQYQHYIQQIPGLAELVKTPLLLSMVVEVLPFLLRDREKSQTFWKQSNQSQVSPMQERITRYKLYEVFVQRWFLSNKISFKYHPLLKEFSEPLKTFNEFSQKIAMLMDAGNQQILEAFLQEGHDVPANPSFFKWDAIFSGRDESIYLVLMNCPLHKRGKHYSFMHDSFRDFFIAQNFLDTLGLAPTAQNAQLILDAKANSDFLLTHPKVVEFFKEMSADAAPLEVSATFQKI